MLNGFGTVDYMFPAYIFLISLVMGLSSLPLIVSKNYETKSIARYSFTPLKKYQYLISLYLGNYITVLISTIIMLIVAKTIYDISFPSSLNILNMILMLFFISIGISSFGIFIASIVKGFQATLSISLLVYFCLLFITGATVPMPVLPEIFQKISGFIPFSHMVMLLQNIWLEYDNNLILHITVTGFSFLCLFTLGLITFKWYDKG